MDIKRIKNGLDDEFLISLNRSELENLCWNFNDFLGEYTPDDCFYYEFIDEFQNKILKVF